MAHGRKQKRIEEQAREWFMLRHERTLNAAEAAAFAQWLSEPAHQHSFHQLEQIDIGLRTVAASAEGARLRAPSHNAQTRLHNLLRRLLAPAPAMAMSFVLILAVATVFVAPREDTATPETYATTVAETRTITLPDGSEVTLAGDSRIETAFSESRRDVTLLRGQAFFSVVKNPARPFYVIAEQASVRVVGTRFDVHRAAGGVEVSVEEGIVDVANRSKDPRTDNTRNKVRLTAGQQVRVNASGTGAIESITVEELASWRRGKLIYRDTSLSEVVADINRYRNGKILLGTPELAELRVTTSFSVEQAETVVSMLEESLPVSVYRESNDRVVIWPKSSPK
ncbi:FecR family protein [Microbulbifer aggregans]|uniref:FecR family protein n=1 Tax=Microbulbifer aggregans TaxID=1769779 RepID=UPI001CFC6457|nr:FecR domain-containing protein [Microbulbifer aggregans]